MIRGKNKNLFLGVLLTVISFFALTATNVAVKLSSLHSSQILFLQHLFGLVIFFFLGIKEKGFFKSSHYGWLFLRALTGVLTFVFMYLSLRYVSVADATLLFNTAPFFIPFMLLVVEKEPIHKRIWLGILVGFLGIMLILHPKDKIFQWHTLLPVLSGIFAASIFVILGRLHAYKEPADRIMFYLFFFGTLMTLPFGIYYWQNPSLKDWIYCLIALVAFFVSKTAITVGLKYARAQTLAPFCYVSVVFAVLFDWLIWNKIPSWNSWVGMILVTLGGIFALLIENTNRNSIYD